MAQVVGMAAITHDHAVISSVICNHILLHVLGLYRKEQPPEKLPLCSTKTLSCPLVYVRVCSSLSRPGRSSVTREGQSSLSRRDPNAGARAGRESAHTQRVASSPSELEANLPGVSAPGRLRRGGCACASI
jgi:hypothetical protein